MAENINKEYKNRFNPDLVIDNSKHWNNVTFPFSPISKENFRITFCLTNIAKYVSPQTKFVVCKFHIFANEFRLFANEILPPFKFTHFT